MAPVLRPKVTVETIWGPHSELWPFALEPGLAGRPKGVRLFEHVDHLSRPAA